MTPIVDYGSLSLLAEAVLAVSRRRATLLCPLPRYALDPGTSFASRAAERGQRTTHERRPTMPMVDGRRGAHDAFRVRRAVGLAVLGSIVVVDGVLAEWCYCLG